MDRHAEIPLIDLGKAGPARLVEIDPDRAAKLVTAGRRQFGGLCVDLLDFASRRWAKRLGGPYLAETKRVAAAGLPRGLWFMNYAYEWGCTTSAAPAAEGPGVELLRALDWPFNELGRQVVVTRQECRAGTLYNVTWPGFLGVVTAMAPGRFCVAINQTPVLRRLNLPFSYPWLLDWIFTRIKTFRGGRLAPAHLLRQVVENCTSYDEALEALTHTPLALPVFFTLAGTRPEEACVIERLEKEARVHHSPATVSNHWLSPGLKGRPRGAESEGRREKMIAGQTRGANGFDWLAPPILNEYTRLAVEANAATAMLRVRGYEKDGAATEVFNLADAEEKLVLDQGGCALAF